MIDTENIVFDQRMIDDAYQMMEQNVLALKNYLKAQGDKLLTVNLGDLSRWLEMPVIEIRDSAAVLLYMGFIKNIDSHHGDVVVIHL
ncbi:hypothetical protein FY034_17545 (plasmid) [Trichlorobacter lovleyi]|uniref:hypothetical protein n=1 Tax=Trichlorobacter lovleyi TaxID=313985 RepID=UPI0022408B2A|nr:hypothetical protein [Trichlorobacter lovleyi]QOX80828.1 hypothetical protein FY034_17545 [Trichlorobacter lovleyi]